MDEIVTAKAVPRPAQMYTLEISQDVAETLAIICRRVGGSPSIKLSRRAHTDRILSALLRSGAIDSADDDVDMDTGLSPRIANTIFFNDYKEKKRIRIV